MFVVHNGTTVDKQKAITTVHNPALFADFRVYETLRIEDSHVVFVEEHIDRLFNSASVIGMNLGCSKEDLEKWIAQCISANQTKKAIYRILVHGDTEDNQQAQVYIYPENSPEPTPEQRAAGIKVVTFTGERIYPSAKTISRLTQFRAGRSAREAGAYEAFLVSPDGTLHEGTRTNIFIVKDGCLVTPELSTILPGIRRRHIIEIARQNNLSVEERQVMVSELADADEVFVTSTIMELVSVGEIDGQKLSASRPIYKQLYQDFQRLKKEYLNAKLTIA